MGFFRLAFVLLILFSCTAVFAKYTSAEMGVNTTWNILADGYITYANLSVSIPSNTSNQKVTSIQISEPYTLEINGSSWRAHIELRNFSEKTVTGLFLVSTNYLERSQLSELPVSTDLNFTKLVDTNNDTQSAANKFSDTIFPNNTILLNSWVHDNINYDTKYTSESYPASWVFKYRRGTCDEYSHLFVSMCRSLGVPTRIIIGYAYSNESWVPHAWAEVYNKEWGWVEVDPTHDEFLNLDALRVRTGTGVDQEETKDKVEAVGLAKEMNFSSSTSINIINKKIEGKLDINLELTAQPEDSLSQPVTIVLKNPTHYPLYLTALLNVPPGVDCSPNCSGDMVLKPGEKKRVSYDLNLSGAVMPDMKYNFSVEAVTDYGNAEENFERQIIIQEFTTVKELPQQFMIFIGIAVGLAIILIIVAIKVRW